MNTQHYESLDGLTLAYHDEGAGLPVIALAGLTRHSADFDFVAPHLHDIRLIRPDYRGRGASDWADPTTYTVEQETRDVLALMAHLGLERAAFLGTSRGGIISMALAANVPERVLGVCLNDIGPVIDPAGLVGVEAHIGRKPAAKTFEQAAAARAQLATGFANVPPERWLADVKNLFREAEGGLENTYDPRLREAFLAVGFDIPPFWPVFDALEGLPTALIHGAGSDILSTETADEMRRRRPDMFFARLPDRGHVPWLDEPEALAVIDAWLGTMR